MRLTKVLQHQVQESDSSMFEIKDHIERNLQYYALEPLGNEQKGRSHYISPDVHDYVESKKAYYSRTFLSNRQVVRFKSGGNTPEGEAEAKTAYVNKALSGDEKHRLFHDIWHDAETSKRGILLAEWVESTKDEEIPLPQPVEVNALLAALGQDPEVLDYDLESADISTGQMGETLLSGSITVTRNDGGFEFTACAPENYYRDPESTGTHDAMWITYEEETPRGTLMRLGYDREQVEELKPERRWKNDDVQFSRSSHDGSYVSTHKTNREKDQESVPLFKTVTWINLSELGEELGEFPDETRYYEIHWSNDEIMRWADGSIAIREIEKCPFFEFTTLRLSHASNGMCGADVVSHTQKVNSVLKRAVIDNQNIRNNTRYEAVHDNLLNPRDLVDNSTGGVIFTEQIGSVAPLASPELSPVTFNVLQMMKEDSEMRSGLSSLTKGMNTSVLENQNAKDMVERLTNAAGARPAADARAFAETFLVPLFKYIVACAKKYDTSQDVTEASGKMIPVVPSSWQGEDDELEISVALTPDEAEAQAQQLITMHQLISQDPVASQLYGVEQRHALFDDVFDSLGVSDTTKYMMRPDDPNFQAQNQQIQELQQMVQMLQGQVQELTQGVTREQLDQAWAQINNSIMDKMEDNQRQDRELRVETRQGDRKLDIDEMKVTGE